MTEYESVIQAGWPPRPRSAESALFVGVERPGLPWPLESSLAELERLADTAGADTWWLRRPSAWTRPTRAPSSARARPTKSLSWHGRTRSTSSLPDDELDTFPAGQSGEGHGQVREGHRPYGLILDIFARNATCEGRRRCVSAQNQYLYSRACAAWAHPRFEPHGRRRDPASGEGESASWRHCCMVRKRITSIRRELERLSDVRLLQRESWYGSGMFSGAGRLHQRRKSRSSTGSPADVLSYDKLFRHAGPPPPQVRAARGPRGHRHRHRRLHPQPPTTPVALSADARRNHRSRPCPACDRCLLAGVRGSRPCACEA